MMARLAAARRVGGGIRCARSMATATATPPPTPASPWLVNFCGGDRIFSAGFEKMQNQLDLRQLNYEIVVERRPDPSVGSDVLVPLMSRISREMIERLTNKEAGGRLKAIVQFGVGLEGIDLDAAAANGVAVLNMPADLTGNATSTAELGLYLCLAAMRKQKESEACFQSRALGMPIGVSLERKKVLIVGYGAVGQKLREMIRPFDTRVAVMKRNWEGGPSSSSQVDAYVESTFASEPAGEDLRIMASDGNALAKALSAADVVFLCATLNETTRNLVDEKFIGHMKDNTFLINVARGGVIKYEALLDALRRNKFLGVGLDVFWSEPFDPDDPIFDYGAVVRTPHIGGVTDVSYGAYLPQRLRARTAFAERFAGPFGESAWLSG